MLLHLYFVRKNNYAIPGYVESFVVACQNEYIARHTYPALRGTAHWDDENQRWQNEAAYVDWDAPAEVVVTEWGIANPGVVGVLEVFNCSG